MMYHQKLVASIKSKGKILREFKDTVYIPFSCEYSILLKNLNTVRAVVYVFIDGENVVPSGLVLNAGQEIDLERSIKNNNLNEGNKFKFIERTGNIEQHRGIKLEDGLVRVEYCFERVYRSSMLDYAWNDNRVYGSPTVGNPSILRGVNISATYSDPITASASVPTKSAKSLTNDMTVSASSFAPNDVGITVAGSKSEQKFQTASWFATESEKHTIVLKLLGETAENTPVQTPITVKHKPKCTTCGKQNKATAKFCSECGTHLEIFA